MSDPSDRGSRVDVPLDEQIDDRIHEALDDEVDATRRSWNVATRNHNAHKGDQSTSLRAGRSTLFDEELALLGDVAGREVVHLQCNAGQDTLSLAQRGARVTGVDVSDEAIAFARALSRDAQLPATFVHAELLRWLSTTNERFDLAFSSYGAVGWLRDVDAWARGIHRVLRPGGRFVYVEFHPLVWSIGPALRVDGDDYFSRAPFREPVGDYVATSGTALWGDGGAALPNEIVATSWQHTLGAIVQALLDAGLQLEVLREWPYANGCRVHPGLVVDEARRWHWPPGTARLPLMFGVCARRA